MRYRWRAQWGLILGNPARKIALEEGKTKALSTVFATQGTGTGERGWQLPSWTQFNSER